MCEECWDRVVPVLVSYWPTAVTHIEVCKCHSLSEAKSVF